MPGEPNDPTRFSFADGQWSENSTSVIGPKRTWPPSTRMSALRGKADLGRAVLKCRLVTRSGSGATGVTAAGTKIGELDAVRGSPPLFKGGFDRSQDGGQSDSMSASGPFP